MKRYDVIIIGKGPAGISAALYTKRANLSTLVIGGDESSLKKASKIENYFGFEHPVTGNELLTAGVNQAKRVGAEIVDSEVTSIAAENGFTVKTPLCKYGSSALLIATGKSHNRPDIPGIREFEGRGVSYCTTCDGFFYRGKKVGVLGNGNYAVQEALELTAFTKDITIFTDGRELALSNDVLPDTGRFEIVKDRVKMLDGNDTLKEIILQDGRQDIDGLFVAYGSASSVDFAAKMGVLVKDNAIITDGRQGTNVEGLFAAGDCTGKILQIASAVGQGASAGISIIEYLKNRKRPADSVREN